MLLLVCVCVGGGEVGACVAESVDRAPGGGAAAFSKNQWQQLANRGAPLPAWWEIWVEWCMWVWAMWEAMASSRHGSTVLMLVGWRGPLLLYCSMPLARGIGVDRLNTIWIHCHPHSTATATSCCRHHT